MKLLHQHFELIFQMVVISTLFIFSCCFLAWYPQRDELARWIEGGPLITALAMSLRRGSQGPTPAPSDKTIISTTVETPEKPPEKEKKEN